MKCAGRAGVREPLSSEPNACTSTPELCVLIPNARRCREKTTVEAQRRTPRDAHSASESNLTVRQNETTAEETTRIDQKPTHHQARGDESDTMRQTSPSPTRPRTATLNVNNATVRARNPKPEKAGKCCLSTTAKKSRSCSPLDAEAPMSRQIRDIHSDMRSSARVIKDSRARLLEIQKKPNLTDADVKELGDRHELLLREMERFDRLTRNVQKLLDNEVVTLTLRKTRDAHRHEFTPLSCCDTAMYHEMKMTHPTVALGGIGPSAGPGHHHSDVTRSKSEIDLTRKLNESYDMQEKLVADNADLEVKRYILYKELMTKDQNLETCRAQIKRLQAELKLMNKENAQLLERLNKNNPEGDATSLNYEQSAKKVLNNQKDSARSSKCSEQLALKLDTYQTSKADLSIPCLGQRSVGRLQTRWSDDDLRQAAQQPDAQRRRLAEWRAPGEAHALLITENQVRVLEIEVRETREEMEQLKKAAEASAAAGPGPQACRGGGHGPNTCFQQPAGGPPVPPMSKACGVCPPCPAPCNPSAPPTPAEKEVARLTIQLRQTEENFKTKVTECAMLRAELLKKKEDLEKERCQHREVQHKLRELEMKFEGLTTHTNMMLGTKEQAFEQEVNVRALKQCYREAREEIDELRILMKEQNEQLQDYRVKYLQAQQLVEEQRRQMDLMDMDNTRISEQINLEIQRVKLKFQEKLQELAPIPDLLKATQIRLKDAQQAQAIAEHNAEQLARELNVAREKVHILLHNSVKPVEKQTERGPDEKQLAMLQQRIAQLTETNLGLKAEIERLKGNVIRMEEAVLANEKRLQEKMHECAQLGGELDRARDEAARALQKNNDRMETIRKCLQTTIAELERQLAAARAQVKQSEKEREELQCRMSCQIKRLKENFEQAQLRIMGLTTQVATLRHATGSTDGDGDVETAECVCKSMFENP